MIRRLLSVFLLVLAMAPAAAHAEWRRAESPNFIVYSEGSESRLRERILLLEDFNRLLRTVTSVAEPPAPNKLHVYIVDGPEDLRAIRAVPPGIGGLYTASADGTAAIVDARAQAGANEVLFHEYAHHFMWQYAPSAYPAWYIEGFAEYFATARFERRRIDVGNFSPGRIASIVQGNWLPIERVLFGQPRELDREGMARYYAQSWLITHYFYSTPERQAALRRYLAAARAGDPRAALQTATGLTPDALNDELRRYIRGGTIRYRRFDRSAEESPPAIAVTTLPASADDLLLYEAALRIGIEDTDQAAYLQRIRSAAARHPQDRLAMRVLAHAEARFGDGAAADRLLETLLAAAPGDAELLYLKGLRHLMAAEKGQDWERDARLAQQWFARAHRADENHYQTLYRYAQSLRQERNFVSENTSNILLLAHQLAPQVAEIRMNAAMQLIARGETAEAEALLGPLAADPHNAGLAQAAQRMIQLARERARPGAAAEERTEDEAREED